MPRHKRTPKELAEVAVRSLVKKLTDARMRVAELESELAEVSSILSGAAGAMPVVKRALPPTLAVPAEELLEQERIDIDLAAEDNMGPGRFV